MNYQNNNAAQRRMDWHLIWAALGVITPILIAVIGFGVSMNKNISLIEKNLNEKIGTLDKRLAVIETVMLMQGTNVKGIAVNNIEKIEDKK